MVILPKHPGGHSQVPGAKAVLVMLVFGLKQMRFGIKPEILADPDIL